MSKANEYDELLHLVVELVEAQAGISIPSDHAWLNDTQVLSKKLFEHLLTLKMLTEPIDVTGDDGKLFSLVAHCSVNVLVRAAFETYLVLNFVYGPDSRDEARFRHLCWRIGGLVDRQRLHTTLDKHKDVQEEELATLTNLKKQVEAAVQFGALPAKKRKLVLGGNWRAGRSWRDLAIMAGFHETYFQNTYGYLCGYAHSSYASAIQVRTADAISDQRRLAESMAQIGLVIMAHFSHFYPTVFPTSQPLVDSLAEKQKLAEKWYFTRDNQAAIYER